MKEQEVTRTAIASAVWAPSLHNTQPWWFTAGERQIVLHADTARQLPVTDPDGRELLISCGAALFNLRLALRLAGLIPQTRVLPDPGEPTLVAEVSFQGEAEPDAYEQRLASQILRRRTHRGAFFPDPLPHGLLGVLRESAALDGATLRVVADPGYRAVLAAAVDSAEQSLRLDSEHVTELSRWVLPPGSARRDGVPPTSYPARPDHTDPDFPGRDFARGHGWGLPPLSCVPPRGAAGVVALLTTPGDRPADWVRAGQAMQRVLLTASSYGAAAALHSQPVELPWLREFLRTLLGDGGYPQLVLRLGLVTQVARSVRRAPDDVIFESRVS